MKRINILLEESDYEKLRQISYETHTPISKLIREWVQVMLGPIEDMDTTGTKIRNALK